jgi:nitrate reductase NapAB chaperone NapD
MSQSRAGSTSRQRQNIPVIPQNKAQNKVAYIPQLSPQYKTPPPPPSASKTIGGAGSYQSQFNNEVKKPQLTIGQTISLITIRLTRVENSLTNLKESNLLPPSSLDETNGNTELSQSSNMFYEFPNANYKEDIHAMENRLNQVEATLTNVVKVENDLQTTKDLLLILMSKQEKYVLDTTAKLQALQNEINELMSFKLQVLSSPPPPPSSSEAVSEEVDVSVSVSVSDPSELQSRYN